MTGEILDKDADGIVIQSRASALWWADRERWEIAYGDIDTLAVTKDRQDIERWVRRFEEKGLEVMVRGELDLSKLRKGWYADVVYTSEGAKRTITGEIIDKDEGRIVIKSKYNAWKRFEIAYGDIDILVVAKDPRDMKGWQKLRQDIEGWREGTSDIRITAKLVFGVLGGVAFTFVGGLVGANINENICNRPQYSSEICIDDEVALGLVVGYVLGVPFTVSTADPYDRFAYTLAGSLIGSATGIALIKAKEELWPSFLICPLVGAVIMSELSRKPPEARRFSVGVVPGPTGRVSAVATFRF